MRAVSAAMRSVHAMASSQPPPRQKPLIAAITGLPMFLDQIEHVLPALRVLLALGRLQRGELVDAAPAMNAFYPTGDDDHADRRIVLEIEDRTAKLVGGRRVRALRTAGRLIVSIATDRRARGGGLSKAMASQSGKKYRTQPSATPPRTNAVKSWAPNRSCSFGSSRMRVRRPRRRTARRRSSARGATPSFAPLRGVSARRALRRLRSRRAHLRYGNAFSSSRGLMNMLVVLDAFDTAQGRK